MGEEEKRKNANWRTKEANFVLVLAADRTHAK